MKHEYPWKGKQAGITGLFLIILLLVVLPVFAGNVYAADEKVKEETLSIKELKDDSPKEGKSPGSEESKESVPASPTSENVKAKTPSAKKENVAPVGNVATPTSSPSPEVDKTKAVPATTDESKVRGDKEGAPDSTAASPSVPLKDDYLFGKEDSGYTGVKLNFPLYIGSILIVSLITILSIKFLGKYMGIPQVGGSQKTMIKILEKQTFGPNKQFCIVEVPGKTVLIGVTENEMKVLCELDLQNVKNFGENEDKPETAASSSTNYIVDVLLRRWQGGK